MSIFREIKDNLSRWDRDGRSISAFRRHSHPQILRQESHWLFDIVNLAHPFFLSIESINIANDLLPDVFDPAGMVDDLLNVRWPFDTCVFEFEVKWSDDPAQIFIHKTMDRYGSQTIEMFSTIHHSGGSFIPMIKSSVRIHVGSDFIDVKRTAMDMTFSNDPERVKAHESQLVIMAILAAKICIMMSVKDGPISTADEVLYPRNLARRLDREGVTYRTPTGAIPQITRVSLSESGRHHMEIVSAGPGDDKEVTRMRGHWVRGHLMKTVNKGYVFRKPHVRGFGSAEIRPYLITARSSNMDPVTKAEI